MVEVRLERPNLYKIIMFSIDSIIFLNSVIMSIVYIDEFNLHLDLFQKFLTYLIVDGILFFLNSYQMTIWFLNIGRLFRSNAEKMYWKAENFYPKMELLLTITSAIIRFSFIEFSWKQLPKLVNIYLAIFIVSIYSYVSIFIIIIFTLIGLSLVIYARNTNQQPIELTTIATEPSNILVNIIPQFVSARENWECAICLDNPPNEQWVNLNCNHQYHYHCFRQYLSSINTVEPNCPICRRPIIQIPSELQSIQV